MIVTGSQEQPQTVPVTWSIYQSCDDLPLRIFRKCLKDNDWSHLVKEGTPPQSVIDDTGLSVYSEYCDLSGGVQLSILIERTCAIQVLTSRIDRISMRIEVVRALADIGLSDDDLISDFAEDGFKVEAARMQVGNRTEYLAALAKIESKLKTDILKLERLRKEAPKPGANEKFSDSDFNKALSAIESHKKIGLDWDSITVLRYCIYVQELRDHIEHLNKQAQVSHGRRTN